MSDKLGKMVTNVIEVEKNGVKVVIKQQYNKEINDINIDFSEHDKVFEDRIYELKKELSKMKQSQDNYFKLLDKYREQNEELTIENQALKQRIAELESKKTFELPFNPLECANYLINSTYERETNGIERTFHNLPEKVNSDRYTVDDLE